MHPHRFEVSFRDPIDVGVQDIGGGDLLQSSVAAIAVLSPGQWMPNAGL
jgi:hypothetical protein